MRCVLLSLVMLSLTACSEAGPQSSADCSAQIRLDGVVYTSYGMSSREADPHVDADEADCDDTGRDPQGSVFPDSPSRVRTWVFEGYPPEEVLGVQYGKNSFGVFVADTVAPDEQERIYADLSGDKQ